MVKLKNGKRVFCKHIVWNGALPICMYKGINYGLADCKDCPHKDYEEDILE